MVSEAAPKKSSGPALQCHHASAHRAPGGRLPGSSRAHHGTWDGNMAGKVASFFYCNYFPSIIDLSQVDLSIYCTIINFQIDLSIYCTVLMCLFLDVHFNLFVCLSIYLSTYLSICLYPFLLTMLDPCQVGIMFVNGKGAMLTPN